MPGALGKRNISAAQIVRDPFLRELPDQLGQRNKVEHSGAADGVLALLHISQSDPDLPVKVRLESETSYVRPFPPWTSMEFKSLCKTNISLMGSPGHAQSTLYEQSIPHLWNQKGN